MATVIINTVGVQGAVGPQGPSGSQGPQGPYPPTGSFATTGSNVFIGNQIVTGSVNVLGSATLNNGPISYNLYAMTASSATVTNTTTESSLIDGGVGSLNIPANGFQVGDSFHAKLIGHISSGNNQTLRIRVKTGNVVLADTDTITIDAISNRHWNIDIYFTVRALGASGVASISSGGVFSYIQNQNLSYAGAVFSTINSSSFDTTTSNILSVTAQWGAASTSNIIYSEYFTLTKLR